jgi:DNA-binding response OmpR family regulator
MKRILVVDNDPEIVECNVAALADEPGFMFGKAYDGKQAVDIATVWPPNVVLLDISLPKRDGFSVLRSLKRNRRTAHAKVIIITGEDGAAAETSSMKLGADGFMVKPVGAEDLRQMVTEVLEINLAAAA